MSLARRLISLGSSSSLSCSSLSLFSLFCRSSLQTIQTGMVREPSATLSRPSSPSHISHCVVVLLAMSRRHRALSLQLHRTSLSLIPITPIPSRLAPPPFVSYSLFTVCKHRSATPFPKFFTVPQSLPWASLDLRRHHCDARGGSWPGGRGPAGRRSPMRSRGSSPSAILSPIRAPPCSYPSLRDLVPWRRLLRFFPVRSHLHHSLSHPVRHLLAPLFHGQIWFPGDLLLSFFQVRKRHVENAFFSAPPPTISFFFFWLVLVPSSKNGLKFSLFLVKENLFPFQQYF